MAEGLLAPLDGVYQHVVLRQHLSLAALGLGSKNPQEQKQIYPDIWRNELCWIKRWKTVQKFQRSESLSA
ncbi:hypothetical protein NECAME_02454 [Necator americanus]|uniref:Uncharacterized protein n=1 Tax=Necator americanus TaxID=51031 RepID=W2TG32_NECAM|nr:hypothetical protein NECAME_02454 [Necator americanus]ETN79977.1 hypothetical protein NECAME_02454 [Necator americanus]